MTEFGGTYDFDAGDEFDPGNHQFDPDLRNPGYSELLAGFHAYCEDQWGATLDIDPDEDSRSQIFQKAIFAVTPNSIPTARISAFSAVLSDGRTDFNAESLLQMSYITEYAADRSVVPISLLNYFMPIGGEHKVEGKTLEVIAGRVAVAAAFETEVARRPEMLLFMDEQGLNSTLMRLSEVQQSIEEKVQKQRPFVYRHETPSVALELLVNSVMVANQVAFDQKVQDDPIAAIEEQAEKGEFIFMGIGGLSKLSDDSEFDLRIIGNRIKQNESGIYLPEFDGLTEQRHLLKIERDDRSGLVSAPQLEGFTETTLAVN